MVGLKEDFLDCLSHIVLFQNFITFINDEEFKFVNFEMFRLNQRESSSWSSDDNLRRIILQSKNLGILIDSSINLSNFKIREVFSESLKLFSDLISKFSCMAHYYCLEWFSGEVDCLKNSEDKNSSFSHSRLGLTEKIVSIDYIRNAFTLNLRGILEPSLSSGSYKFLFKMKIFKS